MELEDWETGRQASKEAAESIAVEMGTWGSEKPLSPLRLGKQRLRSKDRRTGTWGNLPSNSLTIHTEAGEAIGLVGWGWACGQRTETGPGRM